MFLFVNNAFVGVHLDIYLRINIFLVNICLIILYRCCKDFGIVALAFHST